MPTVKVEADFVQQEKKVIDMLHNAQKLARDLDTGVLIVTQARRADTVVEAYRPETTMVDEIDRALATAAMEDQRYVVEDIMPPKPVEEPEWFSGFEKDMRKEEECGESAKV